MKHLKKTCLYVAALFAIAVMVVVVLPLVALETIFNTAKKVAWTLTEKIYAG